MIYAPDNWSVVTRVNGSSSWSTPSQGQVLFTNFGWTTVGGNGNADFTTNTGWTYSFTSNVTGSFVIAIREPES